MSTTSFPGMEHRRTNIPPAPANPPTAKPGPPSPTREDRIEALKVAGAQGFPTCDLTLTAANRYATFIASGDQGRQK